MTSRPRPARRPPARDPAASFYRGRARYLSALSAGLLGLPLLLGSLLNADESWYLLAPAAVILTGSALMWRRADEPIAPTSVDDHSDSTFRRATWRGLVPVLMIIGGLALALLLVQLIQG